MRIILLAVYLLLVLFPFSSYGGGPATLDEAVQLVKNLKERQPPPSNKEIAEFVSQLVDKRITNTNDWGLPGSEADELEKTPAGKAKIKQVTDEREDFGRGLGSDYGNDYALRAEWARNLGYGRCDEIAAITYHILKEAGIQSIKAETSAGGGHGFVVIGMAPGGDPGDPRTWGKDAYVADGWSGQSPDARPDRRGAAAVSQGYEQGAPGAGKPPTAGALGRGQVVEQPGLNPPPPGPGDPGTAGQPSASDLWCYSEKTKEFYRFPYGPCPPPYMQPPASTTTTADPGDNPSWQGLVPPKGKPMGSTTSPATSDQLTGKPGKSAGALPPTSGKPMGPQPACGPATSCCCAGGGMGHIPCDKAKGACHCGAE
jgi:hypothetical protein